MLREHVDTLNALITAGRTLEAMERFYADDVTMQENQESPRVGKQACLDHERRLLAQTTSFEALLHRQVVDKTSGLVFSEWTFATTDTAGQSYRLTQVSVQQWSDERIQSEKFYYSKL